MLIILFITGIMGFSFLQVAAYEAGAVQRYHNELLMMSKGEEALSKGVAQIRAQQVWIAKGQNEFRGWLAPNSDDEFYRAEYTVRGDNKDSLQAVVYGKNDWVTRDTLLLLRNIVRPKFANEYFMLFDRPGAPYFLTGDIIDGKVHSNSYIKTAGTPHFTDVIECVVGSDIGVDQYSHYKGNPSFAKPIVWQSKEYAIEHLAFNIRTSADKRFSNPKRVAEVRLLGKTFQVRYRDAEKPEGAYTAAQSYTLNKLSSLYFEQDVEVRGVLDGQLTIGSLGNITITDDLVYAGSNKKSGKPAAGSKSMLGLIAEKNLFIKKDHRKAQREGGVRINGALIALDSSIQTENLYHRNMGTFHFWGSMTEKVRGINAVSRDDNILFGYKKKWHYDRRLSTIIPPKFTPIKARDGKTEYRVISWHRKY